MADQGRGQQRGGLKTGRVTSRRESGHSVTLITIRLIYSLGTDQCLNVPWFAVSASAIAVQPIQQSVPCGAASEAWPAYQRCRGLAQLGSALSAAALGGGGGGGGDCLPPISAGALRRRHRPRLHRGCAVPGGLNELPQPTLQPELRCATGDR